MSVSEPPCLLLSTDLWLCGHWIFSHVFEEAPDTIILITKRSGGVRFYLDKPDFFSQTGFVAPSRRLAVPVVLVGLTFLVRKDT